MKLLNSQNSKNRKISKVFILIWDKTIGDHMLTIGKYAKKSTHVSEPDILQSLKRNVNSCETTNEYYGKFAFSYVFVNKPMVDLTQFCTA